VASHPSLRYLRREVLPTAFCPGCYNGVVMNALFHALRDLGVEDLRGYVFVSGIGCSSWIPSPYIRADTIHTLHGRAVPVATGVKLARPDLEVVVIAGDGDLAAIGGNHLLHAARRNMDLLVLMVNNQVYAMTRGQASPTTPRGMKTPTTPYGNPETPMDVARIIAGTNANYVARWCISDYMRLKASIEEALSRHRRGFRFIEIYAPCTTYVTRYEGLTPGEKIHSLRKACIPLEKYYSMTHEKREKHIPVGVYKREDKPGFLEQYLSYVGVTQG